MNDARWDAEYDVVVVGSGGGLAGALLAGSEGMRTIVLERTDRFGGLTSYSGAGLWLPGNAVSKRAGLDDSNDIALAYFESVVGDETDKALQRAFVKTGPALVDFLERSPHLRFYWMAFPDYYADRGSPPAHALGRDIFPEGIAQAALGPILDTLRLSMASELGGAEETDPLTGGRALIGRLLLAIRETSCVDLRLETPMERLIVEDERVVGVEASRGGQTIRIRAARGVLLAAGGFERNQAMRDEHRMRGNARWSAGAPGADGSAIRAGIAAGAAVDLMDECWWMPGLLQPYGRSGFIASINGGLMVDRFGRRFADESLPYDRFGREMQSNDPEAGTETRGWWIWDARFGPTIPASVNSLPVLDFDDYAAAGLWKRADTLTALAAEIGVPADILEQTVARFNGFAQSGVDEDFQRGEAPYGVYLQTELPKLFGLEDSTPVGSPNPCLIPVIQAPFYAAAIGLGDLGTKGGLKTDANARVMRPDGSAIAGLYAAGDTMASCTGHHYPAPGSPVGTCMVFSYRAVMDMIGKADEIAFD